MDLSTTVHAQASVRGDAIAVRCEDAVQTYGQLDERSSRLANALASLGVEPGERVATLSDNCLELVEQTCGIARGAYVRAALYTQNVPDSNLYLLNLVEASVLIVHAAHYAAIEAVLSGATDLRHVVVFGGPSPEGTHDYERLLAAASGDDPGVALEDDAPHIIRFSAGTTGKPKGIMHTLRGWRGVASEMALVMPKLDENDKYLAAGPLSHAALLPLFGVLAAGASVVVMPTFDPARFVELVEAERCTVTLLVPTMIQVIASQPATKDGDLSSLRAVLYGAAPISDRTLADGRAIWGDIMYQLYGQSEAIPVSVLTPEDHVGVRTRSAGRPTPNTVIRIVDADGHDVPQGEIGEIAVNTPGLLAAVWKDDAALAERKLPDGSLLTRDMGYVDEDGFMFLADRKDDLIISGGFNIWPAELENAIAAHPAVAEVAVVGVPHPKWGETPKAAVVLRAGLIADEAEIVEWSREKLGSIKRVTSVDFVDSLPKSALGKVLRREVRQRYWQESGRTIAGA